MYLLLIILLSIMNDGNTIKKKNKTILIDGLEDAFWKSIPSHGPFVQYSPNISEDPSNQTEFKLTYDAHYIYLFVKSFQK